MDLQVTDIEKLRKLAQGTIVQLSPFIEGTEPFVVRLRRPNLLNLLAQGKIPNTLVGAVNRIMFGEDQKSKNKTVEEEIKEVKEMAELLKIVAKESLLEPKFETLEELNLNLTEQQTLEIFEFVQKGVKALEPFRKDDESSTDN